MQELFRQLKKVGGLWAGAIDRQQAKSIEKIHSEIALQIWRDNALRLIGEMKPSKYPEAASCFRRVQKRYEAGGLHDKWRSLIVNVRKKHKTKRQLMGVLDELEKSGAVYLTNCREP